MAEIKRSQPSTQTLSKSGRTKRQQAAFIFGTGSGDEDESSEDDTARHEAIVSGRTLSAVPVGRGAMFTFGPSDTEDESSEDEAPPSAPSDKKSDAPPLPLRRRTTIEWDEASLFAALQRVQAAKDVARHASAEESDTSTEEHDTSDEDIEDTSADEADDEQLKPSRALTRRRSIFTSAASASGWPAGERGQASG
ncbi:uncharacterized protein MKK02DRAFT_42867 [Dioszegia hungarica]|uniref:Uncharacterized protein n=1 Tax=Dioszegia hungarica TaxID=4972 RepID=A0AA38LY13_9TREE|nr:uncharacterized protein MKK02DRAFT_42867 [Dioszegia hungarica]KAI9638474.1 hypothetical protein MKK02DRAFT_42867 [Dioszegia hungarica]